MKILKRGLTSFDPAIANSLIMSEDDMNRLAKAGTLKVRKAGSIDKKEKCKYDHEDETTSDAQRLALITYF